jgi:hypothetical protein
MRYRPVQLATTWHSPRRSFRTKAICTILESGALFRVLEAKSSHHVVICSVDLVAYPRTIRSQAKDRNRLDVQHPSSGQAQDSCLCTTPVSMLEELMEQRIPHYRYLCQARTTQMEASSCLGKVDVRDVRYGITHKENFSD